MTAEQWVQIVSVSSAVVSVILAVFAIWLSWQFYKASTASTEQMNQAARAIESGVAQLDRLFGSLYADTFSMMRDTVTDMRKRAFEPPAPAPPELRDAISAQVEEGLKVLRGDISKEVAAISQRSGVPEAKAAAVREQVEQVVDRAISGARSIEEAVRTDPAMTIARASVLGQIGGWAPGAPYAGKKTIGAILGNSTLTSHTGVVRVERAIKQLAEEGILALNGAFGPATEVELTPKGHEVMRERWARDAEAAQARREQLRREDELLRQEDAARDALAQRPA